MVPLRHGTSRFLLLITCYPQEPHTGPPSPSHSTEVSVVYIGLDPSLDNYLLVEPYIPAPPPSTRAVIHLSTRVMVPLRHGTSRFLLLITRYKPSLRLVPRRHFASTTRAFPRILILENVDTSSSTKPAETSVSSIRAGVHTRPLRLLRIVTAAGSAPSLRVLSITCAFLVYLFSRPSTHPAPPSLPRHPLRPSALEYILAPCD